MSESQHVEWKESWRDEHLKWLCGFANAQGGVLEIGRDDRGRVIGLKDAPRLLEELPNKLRDLLGIVADIDLREEDSKEYLRIAVDPYPVPISYRGEYHYRSGTTKQVLRGAALDRFLLGKTGKRWDGVPVPGVGIADLDGKVLDRFRERAARSKRLRAEALNDDDPGLIEKLRLLEGKYLKRAAVLLFHPDPERFFTGAAVKIGFFAGESDLRYHDEVTGPLFTQAGNTLELLLTKYLKAAISYEGIHRIESFPVPEEALREAVVNAIVHRDYAVAAPIQIRVYDDRLSIWNPGQLPEGWSFETLLGLHPSQPYNPDVANAFFRAGEIEAWGRGIRRVMEACRAAETPEPRIRVEPGDFWFEFPFSKTYLEGIGRPEEGAGVSGGTTQETTQETTQKTSVETSVETPVETPVKTPERILEELSADPTLTLAEVAARIGKSLRAVERSVSKLVKDGRLRHVGPRKSGRWEDREES